MLLNIFASMIALLLSFDNIYVLSDLLKGFKRSDKLAFLFVGLLLSETGQTLGIQALSWLFSIPVVLVGVAVLLMYIGWGILTGNEEASIAGILQRLGRIAGIKAHWGSGRRSLLIRFALTDILFSLDSAANTAGLLRGANWGTIIGVVIGTALPMIALIFAIDWLRKVRGLEKWLELIGGMAVCSGAINVLRDEHINVIVLWSIICLLCLWAAIGVWGWISRSKRAD